MLHRCPCFRFDCAFVFALLCFALLCFRYALLRFALSCCACNQDNTVCLALIAWLGFALLRFASLCFASICAPCIALRALLCVVLFPLIGGRCIGFPGGRQVMHRVFRHGVQRQRSFCCHNIVQSGCARCCALRPMLASLQYSNALGRLCNGAIAR